jgi:hypothetical protein
MLVRLSTQQKNMGVVAYICNPRHRGGINRKIMVQASPGKKHKTLPEKQLKQKELWA